MTHPEINISLENFPTFQVDENETPALASEHLEPFVMESLEAHADRLAELSQSIWENPELAFEEKHAVGLLTGYLEKEGYPVTCPYGGLETAFRAEFQTRGYNPSCHPTVAVLCEYDALPEIGHACGHNLISEAGLGTFISVCETLKNQPDVEGKVVCMGTPAEEGGGGKVLLLAAGAFKDIHFAMMVHPAPIDVLELAILGIDRCVVEYMGKAAHASCGPWEGVNALDAAIAAYNNISMLRQQLPAAHQIHMTIMNGGSKPSVIPDHTSSTYFIRAPTVAGMIMLKNKVSACLEAAALSSGCEVKYEFGDAAYGPLLINKTMLSVYYHYGKKHGMFFPIIRPSYGSTDMGDVSTVIPSIHPAFGAGGLHMIHTKEFAVVAGKHGAHKLARRAGLAMAMTTLELLSNAEFRQKAREDFERNLLNFVGSSDATDGGTF